MYGKRNEKKKFINKLLINFKLLKKVNLCVVCRVVIIVNSIMLKYIYYDGKLSYIVRVCIMFKICF